MREPTVAIATTGFSRLGTCQARVVLAVLLTVTVGLVAVTLSPLSKGFAGVKRKGPSDAVLYEREIERIRGGETYYEAATAELTKWGYPTASVFNWRTPLPMSLIGALPDPALGKAVLVLLAAVTLLLAFEWLAREAGVVQAVVGTLALTGALMFCVLANKFVMPVLWAGTLIGLSLCAYGLNRRLLAVVAGLAALFFRDLAGPYCVLALILAIKERRRDEASAWIAGLVAYSIFFGRHALQVAIHQPVDGHAHAESWLQMGGAAFVLATAQVNAYLLLLPQWVTAVFFALTLLGFAGWHTAGGQRAGLTVMMYVVLFAFVGHDFNQYWGALVAPAACLGFAHFPASLADLWRAARYRSSPSPGTSESLSTSSS